MDRDRRGSRSGNVQRICNGHYLRYRSGKKRNVFQRKITVHYELSDGMPSWASELSLDGFQQSSSKLRCS
eukprot:761837-Hanusia_phi.AAC.7